MNLGLGYKRGESTGAYKLSNQVLDDVKWGRMRIFLDKKESLHDYALFQSCVADSVSCLFLTRALRNSFDINAAAESEEIQRQLYDFNDYLETCKFIKYDSCADELAEGGVLDMEKFPALSILDTIEPLRSYISELENLHAIHEFYAFRKGLLNFSEWEHHFSGLRSNLVMNYRCFSTLNNSHFEHGLYQHISLIRKLKNDNKVTDSSSIWNIPECLRSSLLEEINRQYSEELLSFFKEHKERKIKHHYQRLKFMNLLKKRADEAQAARVFYLPQENQPSEKPLRNGLKLDKLSLLKDRIRVKPKGGSINCLFQLVLVGAMAFVLSTMKGKV